MLALPGSCRVREWTNVGVPVTYTSRRHPAYPVPREVIEALPVTVTFSPSEAEMSVVAADAMLADEIEYVDRRIDA